MLDLTRVKTLINLLRFELLFQKFLFNFDIWFTKVTSNDRELDADFIGVYFREGK